MMVLGFCTNYGGRFGNIPVIQCGKFKLIQVKDYPSVPLPLLYLLMRAKETGADFLVIDPDVNPITNKKANWVDVPQGKAVA